jgi:RimJ/RimL family protein N-acetyltransferase
VVIKIPQRLEATGVALRLVRVQDIGPYQKAFAEDPDLGRLLRMEEDPSEEDVRGRIGGSERRAADGKGLELAIETAGAFVGAVIAHSFSWTHRRCEIGFWLVPEARRRGVTAAAVWPPQPH